MANSEVSDSTAAASVGRTRSWWHVPLVLWAILAACALRVDAYMAFIMTSWVVFGLLAFSLDLVWGKGGDLSLGHTVFFGVGAYAYALTAINLVPVLGNSVLLAVIAGSVTGALAAALIGYFIFYGRLGPFQATIITYTTTLLMATVAVSATFVVGKARAGGANGIAGIPPLSFELVGLSGALSRQHALVATITISALLVAGVLYLLRKPFGLIIEGCRQDGLKVELLGYDIRRYRLLLFTLSGAIAGVAGALFAAWAAHVSPTLFGVVQALLVPIYVLVGGLGSLYGAFFGALFIGALTFWLGGGAGGDQTTLILGVVLILVVLFVPKGIFGLLRTGFRKKSPVVSDRGDFERSDLSVLDDIFDADGERRIIFEARGLNKRYGGVIATDNLSLEFHSRGVHCLIGPNGAGKSTFLALCVGLIKPDSGQLLFDGADISQTESFERARLGIGIKLQVASVLADSTVYDNLWLAAYSKSRDEERAVRMVKQVLGAIGLAHKADVPASELSHGQQQWLDIGMVLCNEPKLVFLDEPVAGMSASERQSTVEIIRSLGRHVGIIVVEHDMDFVRELNSPVTVLHQGAVFASGSIDELRHNEEVLDIYLGRQKHA